MKIRTLILVGIAGLALSACSTGSTVQYGDSSAKLYKVAQDDTLQDIALEEYGCKSSWIDIYEANTDTIDNANLIYPNQVIRLPLEDEGVVVKSSVSKKVVNEVDKSGSFPENPWDFNVNRRK
jgi:hypothetical protein